MNAFTAVAIDRVADLSVSITDADRQAAAREIKRLQGIEKAAAELAACKTLQVQAQPLTPGPQRSELMQAYVARVGPAWDSLFARLGLDVAQLEYHAGRRSAAPAERQHPDGRVDCGFCHNPTSGCAPELCSYRSPQ